MNGASSSLLPTLAGLLGSLAGLGALIGVWLNWRRAPADIRLITLQGDVAEATRGKTEAERDSIAFNVISKALADADRTIDRVCVEREYWKNDSAYWKARAEKAERSLLEEELKRLPEQGG